jgi:rhamnose utilization protein RhaD (predicted bifunctional aldolase and dehydrogenase)/NAD(P)-dependent dehydrogenase (short-subunit alcohol dehydrogenase family)
MDSTWQDGESAKYASDLEQRVYTSRLLGREPALVLHGGGNTSVKTIERDFFGDDIATLRVKGSGWDLDTIDARGFAPVRMDVLLRLSSLDQLTDTDMAQQMRLGLLDPAAPAPSVEAILHALIPFKFVDHTHADAIISLCNTPSGERHVREVYGDDVIAAPYVMPGFLLARLGARQCVPHIGPGTLGLVLMNHGLFTWGETARESYERHIALVNRAEDFLRNRGAWQIAWSTPARPHGALRVARAQLRADISRAAGAPMIVQSHDDDRHLAYAQHAGISTISQSGPATPDHVIRTKRVPLIGRDVVAYAAAYQDYFARNAAQHPDGARLIMLDPAPRVVLDPELGVCVAGRTVKDARIAFDIADHTLDIIARATQLERWQALPERDLFDVEYWDLEQAKLKRQPKPGEFGGEVALVTGAASGIGKACVESLRARGAAVIALDLNSAIESLFGAPDVLSIACDVSDEAALEGALEAGVKAYGGLDMLVLNAGIFPASKRIDALSTAEWDKVMRINLDANLALMRLSHPLLKLAPNGGRIAIVGSKNVPAPGPGAAAYSASKAALTQLARVAALEWGGDGIRVNVVHPNAVFDTGIWSDDILKARAASYGLTVEEYKTNNVLRTPVTSHDVAELVATMCGAIFAKTTGAQVPIDGGNDRVI